ncbi:MAG: DMT family transporter [Candidatus Njordarchaeia archaeon]
MGDRKRCLLEGVTGGICFSTAAIFIRLLSLNAESIIVWRMLLGGFILLVALRSSMEVVREYKYYSIILGTFLFLHFYFFVKSVQDTYVLNSTILVNMAPIVSIVIVAILGTERLGRWDALAVSLSFLGVLIMFIGGGAIKFGLVGDFEALAAAFMISIYAVTARGKMKEIEHSFILSGLIYIVAGGEAIVLSVLTGKFQVPASQLDVLYILGLGIIPTALGHSLYLKSLKGLSPHETQILALLEPIGATILAIILLNEFPPSYSIIGSIVIALSIIIVAGKKANFQ